jgi:hypothetical protein
MWKCKSDFLWFKEGQVVTEIQDNWKPYFTEVVKESPKAILVSEPPEEIPVIKSSVFGLKRGRPKVRK